MVSIFISHSHSDWRVAECLQSLLEQVSSGGFQVERSSQTGAIKAGENWREWINDKVLSCDVAIVLLTPASFRGRWVLWEAGAVAGVQYERLKEAPIEGKDPLARRVRVLGFNLDHQDLGPFGNTQAKDGLKADDMDAFMTELLMENRDKLNEKAYAQGFRLLQTKVQEFVQAAAKALRYTPIEASEGLVQDWLGRLDEEKAKENDKWIIAAKRWINVAFLGAGRASAHTQGEAIDFRIHIRIAAAHRRLGDWPGVAEQLQLAAQLSPNDLVVLRELGRAYRDMGDTGALQSVMSQMEQLDSEIFKKDREGVTLRCGYFAKMNDWVKVDELLSQVDPGIVSQDAYLAYWHAFATMKAKGAEKSLPLFRQLKDLLKRTGSGFWNQANLVNAHLALNELDEARAVLAELSLWQKSKDEVESATRFYDEILSSFDRGFDWRKAARIA